MDKFKIGDRVIIKDKNHPWKGHSGVIQEEMHTPVGFMWNVALDNGMNAGANPEVLEKA